MSIRAATNDPRVDGRPGSVGDVVLYIGPFGPALLFKTDTGDTDWGAGNALSAVGRLFSIEDPAATGTDDIHALYDSVELSTTEGFTNPDVPRNLVVVKSASWDGGTVTLHGTNQFDEVITELFPAEVAGTETGVKIFKTVTQLDHSVALAGGAGVSVGSGAKLGLPYKVVGTDGVLFEDGTAAPVVVDPTYSAFTPDTPSDGSILYQIVVNVTAT
jgi:hypothetical protein